MNTQRRRRLIFLDTVIFSLLVWGAVAFLADFMHWLGPSLLDSLWIIGGAFLVVSLLVWRLERRHGIRLAIVAVSFPLALGISELLFQWFALRPFLPYDEESFRRDIASSWRNPVPIRRMAHRFRIVGLADSYGRAGGHQNFHYLLEDRLNASGDEYEVVNISLGAIEMEHERKLLDRFAMRYHPDLVLHSFFVGNDFGSIAGDYVDFGGIHFHLKKGRRAFRPANFALSQWGNRFLKLCRERWRQERERLDGGGTFSEASFLEIEKGKLKLFERNSEYLSRSWERAKENLRAIHRRAEEGGAVVVLVIHPDQLQVEPGLRKRLAGAFSVNF